MGTIHLHLPDSLHASAREWAKQLNIPVNQLITLALAEKISALIAEEFLNGRAARGGQSKFRNAMTKSVRVKAPDQDRL